MDYKRIIKDRGTRERILRALRFIPDRTMLEMQYRIKTGRRLNLREPARFTEKLQWYKLYYRDPVMIDCVDKFEVRSYIQAQGYGSLLNACYGVWDSFDEIPQQALPKQFVLKDTLGSGGNAVVLCRDRDQLDWENAKAAADAWCAVPLVPDGGREWPYYSGKRHRIMAEEFLCPSGGDLRDYKFFCFSGKVEFAYVCSRRQKGRSVQIDLVTPEYEKLNVIRVGDEPNGPLPDKPKNFDEMVRIAQALSAAFPHVRVDLYNLDGDIRFGELTFFNASGYMIFDPDTFDLDIGRRFILPQAQQTRERKSCRGSKP